MGGKLRHIRDTPSQIREALQGCKSLRGFALSSGASRARTGDPLLAKQVLSQLSYGPFDAPRRASRAAHAFDTKLMKPTAGLNTRFARGGPEGLPWRIHPAGRPVPPIPERRRPHQERSV